MVDLNLQLGVKAICHIYFFCGLVSLDDMGVSLVGLLKALTLLLAFSLGEDPVRDGGPKLALSANCNPHMDFGFTGEGGRG